MTKAVAYGYMEDGQLKILNRARLMDDLKAFKNCDVEITIKKKGKRSTQQNRYYFGVVVDEIRRNLNERGNRFDPATVHEYLKQRFNYESIVIEDTGERIDIGQTTTELNKDQFAEYLTQIIEWASISLGLVIPEANTQTEMF